MRHAAEYRTRARYSLNKKYGTIIAAQVISGMIISTALFALIFGVIFALMGIQFSVHSYPNGVPFSVVLLSIVLAALFFIIMFAQVLLNCGILKLVCSAWKNEPAVLGDMFYGLKGKAPLRVICINLLIGLLELVFMIPYQVCVIAMMFQKHAALLLVLPLILTYLLLIAGVVIVTLFFGLSMYIFVDQPELRAIQCMKASMYLTRGRRWNLFCLYCSFIGWEILVSLSFGIGMLWVAPYLHCTLFHFYEDLKLEKAGQGAQPVFN